MRFLLFLLLVSCGVYGSVISKFLDYRDKLFGTPPPLPANRVPHEPRAVCPDPKGDHSKDFTRDTAAFCFHYLADINCDHALDANELDVGRVKHLTYFERAVVFLFTSTRVIMNACDKDKDGKISRDEFVNNYDGCMNTQKELCHVRDICFREIPKFYPLCANKRNEEIESGKVIPS
jgi:hypothetical protein